MPLIRNRLADLADPARAKVSQRFFKTGPGEYGEGDRFIGIRVPMIRKLSKEYAGLSLNESLTLLKSPIHEERLLALFILIRRYLSNGDDEKKTIYDSYLAHTRYINNWDLVDTSAEHIVGRFLMYRDKGPLYRLARSTSLWERRIAVLATFHFIRQNRFEETFEISEILLDDPEDLIHKAVGWMLREVGKRRKDLLNRFLDAHSRAMPRTMLRYAVERYPEAERKRFLRKKNSPSR
ncbi:MAG: DNA alkylation repair protein [Pseudomonadota bacterium]